MLPFQQIPTIPIPVPAVPPRSGLGHGRFPFRGPLLGLLRSILRSPRRRGPWGHAAAAGAEVVAPGPRLARREGHRWKASAKNDGGTSWWFLGGFGEDFGRILGGFGGFWGGFSWGFPWFFMVNIKNDLSQGLEKLEKIAEFYNDHNWEPRKRNMCFYFCWFWISQKCLAMWSFIQCMEVGKTWYLG